MYNSPRLRDYLYSTIFHILPITAFVLFAPDTSIKNPPIQPKKPGMVNLVSAESLLLPYYSDVPSELGQENTSSKHRTEKEEGIISPIKLKEKPGKTYEIPIKREKVKIPDLEFKVSRNQYINRTYLLSQLDDLINNYGDIDYFYKNRFKEADRDQNTFSYLFESYMQAYLRKDENSSELMKILNDNIHILEIAMLTIEFNNDRSFELTDIIFNPETRDKDSIEKYFDRMFARMNHQFINPEDAGIEAPYTVSYIFSNLLFLHNLITTGTSK